jgi:hypothetical protein
MYISVAQRQSLYVLLLTYSNSPRQYTSQRSLNEKFVRKSNTCVLARVHDMRVEICVLCYWSSWVQYESKKVNGGSGSVKVAVLPRNNSSTPEVHVRYYCVNVSYMQMDTILLHQTYKHKSVVVLTS